MTASVPEPSPRVAVVTGGSRGLGRALASSLAERGWHLIIDGRDPGTLGDAVAEMARESGVVSIAGDVADPAHRRAIVDAVEQEGRLDLLVNNASVLGPSPLVPLAELSVRALERVYAVNTLAPLGLLQLLLPHLNRSGGRIVNVTSDAAVEPYAGWGGYGSAKAALDQLSAVLAVELPALRIYAFDPGDMATDLHQQACPGEDISDLPSPASVVPALLRLIDDDLPSGRFRAAALIGEPVVR